jgi:hypothetical protein
MPFTRQTLPRSPALVNERFRVTVFCLDRASAPQKGSCSGSSCIDLAAQRRPASRRFWKLISRFQGRRNVERSDFRMLALRTYGQPLGPRPRQEAVCPAGNVGLPREKPNRSHSARQTNSMSRTRASVRFRAYSGRHRRTHCGGSTFQRQFLNHSAVYVGVKRRVRFHQVRADLR